MENRMPILTRFSIATPATKNPTTRVPACWRGVMGPYCPVASMANVGGIILHTV
jgi:hypothetical protein